MRHALSGSLSLKKHSCTLGLFKKIAEKKKAEKTFLQLCFTKIINLLIRFKALVLFVLM